MSPSVNIPFSQSATLIEVQLGIVFHRIRSADRLFVATKEKVGIYSGST
jgi:hypothetical protein